MVLKVAVVGNCQIGPLRQIMEVMLGDVYMPSLPAVHTILEKDYSRIESTLSEMDFIIAQQVSDDYAVVPVRTSTLRHVFGDKVITWPNIYFDGYNPEYSVLRDSDYMNFRGPLYDYHSDKILYSFLTGKTVETATQFVENTSELDQLWYGTAVERSIEALRKREASADIGISDYIMDNFAANRLFYVMNHPSNFLLIELADRIIKHLDIRNAKRPQPWMVADFGLNYVFHHENPYIRDHWNLSFPTTLHARGAKMVVAENILGCAPGAAALFTPQELVEEFFNFYAPHQDRLRRTQRAQALLSRSTS